MKDVMASIKYSIVSIVVLFVCCDDTSGKRHQHQHDPVALSVDMDTTILGIYRSSREYIHHFLELKKEQRFRYNKSWSACVSGGKDKIIEGCFAIEDNHITLFPDLYLEHDIEGFGKLFKINT